MTIQQLLSDWRSTYAQWVSAELQLRAARQQQNSGRMVPLLEQRIRMLKQQCSECQDAVSRALSDRPPPSRAAPHALEDVEP